MAKMLIMAKKVWPRRYWKSKKKASRDIVDLLSEMIYRNSLKGLFKKYKKLKK